MQLLDAYELGLADGFYSGDECSRDESWSDELRVAYRRGYDRGVAMYCDTLDEVGGEFACEVFEIRPPCLCGRGGCPYCGVKQYES